MIVSQANAKRTKPFATIACTDNVSALMVEVVKANNNSKCDMSVLISIIYLLTPTFVFYATCAILSPRPLSYKVTLCTGTSSSWLVNSFFLNLSCSPLPGDRGPMNNIPVC